MESELWHSFVGPTQCSNREGQLRMARPAATSPPLPAALDVSGPLSPDFRFQITCNRSKKRQTVLHRTSVEQERHGLLLWYSSFTPSAPAAPTWILNGCDYDLLSKSGAGSDKVEEGCVRARPAALGMNESLLTRDVEALKTDLIAFFFFSCTLNVASRWITGAGSIWRIWQSSRTNLSGIQLHSGGNDWQKEQIKFWRRTSPKKNCGLWI